jgi:hypothetical protein
LTASYTWLNHLVLGQPMGLLSLTFNFDAHLSIYVPSILSTSSSHCNSLFSNSINKFQFQLLF